MVCSNSKERYQTAGEVLQELQIPSSEPTTPTISLAPGQYRVSSPTSSPGLNQRFFISFGVIFSLVCGMFFVFPFFQRQLAVYAQEKCLEEINSSSIQTQLANYSNQDSKLFKLLNGEIKEVKDSQLNDCGTKIDKRGDKYQGIFNNSLLNGRGILIFKNGDTYKGEFQDDNPHGQGTYIHKKSRNKYVGEYKNGLRNGLGKFIYKNGCKYEGIFEKALPVGE